MSSASSDAPRLAYRLACALEFDAPVRGHVFALRCVPRDAAPGSTLRCDPAAALHPWRDAFGNTVAAGRIDAPHARFAFVSEGVAHPSPCPDRAPPQPFLRHASGLTAPGAALRALFRGTAPEATASGTARALSLLVHRTLAYAPGLTSVRTSAEEALAQGAGVCQDYAHVLLALLRMRGIACRYVTGLIPGEGATHAWAEYWDGGRWEALDPTHGTIALSTYIKIAQGSDYSDCPVERGIFFGAAGQRMTVTARVQEIPSAPQT